MKRIIGVILTLVVVLGFCMDGTTVHAANFTISKTEYTVVSVSKGTDVYSDWKRLTDVTRAGRNGEGGHYSKKYTVKTTGSISAEIPIKQLTLKLGYSVEKSKSSTVFGYRSANLKKGQSCALYYRDHWKQYTVTLKVKEYQGKKVVRQYTTTRVIKVPQNTNSAYDYGWMYTTGAASRLGKTLPKRVKKGDWI